MGVVVVTGGAGFIGGHVAGLLVSRGYEVVVVDDLSSGSRGNVPPGARLVVADVSDPGLPGLLRGVVGRAEGFIHLAAVVSVEAAEREPARAVSVNVLGTLYALEAALALGARVFVYAGSAAVYGEPRRLPIGENHPLEPANLYGDTKLMGEMLVRRYTRSRGIRGVVLRLFNVYGPGMPSGPYSGVVRRFIEAVLRGEPPTIYGDGGQTRDFVYVGDVAEAFQAALERGEAGVFNIGSGRETSILQLYHEICRLARPGSCPSPVYRPPRPGDVARSLASIERARETLGWRPRTGLEEGLRRTLRHYAAGAPF